jgi:hypothetical protein
LVTPNRLIVQNVKKALLVANAISLQWQLLLARGLREWVFVLRCRVHNLRDPFLSRFRTLGTRDVPQ